MSRRGGGDPLNISTRRRAEERQIANLAVVSQQTQLQSRVNFETRSTSALNRTLSKNQLEVASDDARAQLEARRARLATLLREEEAAHKRELEATIETPSQTKERLFAYARSLKAENEARRAGLVAELEAARFRAQSDVLRARDSAIQAGRVAARQAAQVREKAEAAEAAAAVERSAAVAARLAGAATLVLRSGKKSYAIARFT